MTISSLATAATSSSLHTASANNVATNLHLVMVELLYLRCVAREGQGGGGNLTVSESKFQVRSNVPATVPLLAVCRSYERMGRASVMCVSGCTCEPSVLEGHSKERNSQLHLHTFYVSQAMKCVIEIKGKIKILLHLMEPGGSLSAGWYP